MRHRVVTLVGTQQEMYPVTCASAVFGYHGPDIPQRYDFQLCAERPGPISTTMGARIVVDHGLEAMESAGTIVIAGWCIESTPALLDRVRAAHRRGARIVAVAGGIEVPARLGLLDGRRAATHWELVADLTRRHPLVTFDAKPLYLDHGDVATAGATATTMDLCLHLVRRDHGAALAMRIGRQFAAPPLREGSQRQYPELPTTGPVPDSLAPLLEWITDNLARPLSVGDMAAWTGVSARTLTRQFADQLGISPGRWLLSRRLSSTRALLEETDLPIETIAKRVGLSSAVNLRRRFHSALTTTPAAYRRSFR